MDIVRNSADPPRPLAWYGRKKFGRLGWAQIPPPYRSLDILTLKVWMYKIKLWESSDQSNNFLLNIGGWVVRWPYSFSVLNHIYHSKTKILFRDLQNKLLYNKLFRTRSSKDPPPLLHMSILFFDKKFGCGADPPPFSDNVQYSIVFFMASLSSLS